MKFIIVILITGIAVYSETLFEVKDSANNKVLDVSTDGLRVMNEGDTLMVISADAIRANIGSSKGLSRSFSVTTTSSVKGKGLINALEVDAGSASMTSPLGQYTDFSPENIFIGLNAGMTVGSGTNNVIIGNGAASTGAGISNSVFIGDKAGKSTYGEANVFVGSGTGQFNTSGGYNTYVGWWTGLNNNGNRNVCIGPWAGMSATGDVNDDNVLIGYNAGWSLHGSGNILIGSNIGGSTYNNRLNIGDLITGDMSANTVRVLGSLSLNSGTSVNEFSIDGTMAGNSDLAVPTEKAVRTYVTASKDNLGNHTATQNIRLNGYYLSNDGGNEGIYVDADGDVGLGTNVPDRPLSIEGKDSNEELMSFKIGGVTKWHINMAGSGIDIVETGIAGERLYIAPGGNIGLGTFPSYQLHLTQNSAAKPSSSYWTIASDIRLKDLKGDYAKGLDEIIKLEPIVYRYKENNEMGIKETGTDAFGFVAQDVQKIFPEAVTENDKGYLALDLHPVFVAQVNAIKTLNSKIEILESENENLKKEIEEIKRLILK